MAQRARRHGRGDGRRPHRAHAARWPQLAADDGAAAAAAGAQPGGAPMSATRRSRRDRAAALRERLDWLPLAAGAGARARRLPLIGSPSTWLTLTVAGLAMGMIIFIMASGLTLVFGLMDVINFGHGAFIALGAFVGAVACWRRWRAGPARPIACCSTSRRWLPAMLAAMVVDRRARLAVRARDRAAGLRPAPEADPDHHGRPDHRRAADPRDLGPDADPAAAAAGAARLVRARRRGGREATASSRSASASRCSSPCCWCSTAPRSAC